MQLRRLCSVVPAGESHGFRGACDVKVTAVSFSPNNQKLAVSGVDKVIRLFDEQGNAFDKFSTKPAEKGYRSYIVRAMSFSPDSTRLAVAQSDSIVFVYKIGIEWGEKKSICNKFLHTSAVTSLTWPPARPNESVYGLADGKVKIGQLRLNKPATLYATDSYVCAVASSPDGLAICSSHADGSIHRFYLQQAGRSLEMTKIAHHENLAHALAWGRSIVVGGVDGRVAFYDDHGRLETAFFYENSGEFTVATPNPSGDTVVLGNWNSIYSFTSGRQKSWEQTSVTTVDNLQAVTALAWKHDGTRVAVASLFGTVDLYDACIKRYRYQGKFELTYSSLSQVVVTRLETGTRVVLRSLYGCAISKINIFQDRFVVANARDHASSVETLLLGDLLTHRLSEISWANGGNERFVFDNPSCCVVHQDGELTLVEYGSNQVLAVIRSDYISGHLLSLCSNVQVSKGQRVSTLEIKKIAYLVDAQTVHIRDLISGSLTNIPHDTKVDWLEFNGRGTMILFRDKRRQLHLFNLSSQVHTTLLSHCTYVQWVPDSDVVVAQSLGNLCVWYNMHCPDQITMHDIRGDIEDIERTPGRTEVIVDEQLSTTSYLLDEALIQFGSSLDDQSFNLASELLEMLETSPETEAMWYKLEDSALSVIDLDVAERCAAALGNVSRCRYLRKVNKHVRGEKNAETHSYVSRAKYSLLTKDVIAAQDIFLSQGKVEDAIRMHQLFHNFEQAVATAELKSYSVDSMRNYHNQCLKNQGVKAAQLREKHGEFQEAIELALSSGIPGRAAQLIKQHGIVSQVMDKVASSLTAVGLHEHAGELFEKMDQLQRALDAYVQGRSYRKAVELARSYFPGRVVELHEAWGDALLEEGQVEMAINHYIEASLSTKAVEAAVGAKLWNRAAGLLTNLDTTAARPFLCELAQHYDATGDRLRAEKCFIDAGYPNLAVEMYTREHLWENAHRVASTFMPPREVNLLCISRAQKLESEGKLHDAEALYVTVDEPDLAINMYKRQRKYEAMIRLVERHRSGLLQETHQYLAQHLESEGCLQGAEHHYCEAGEWLSAVNMYRTNDMWNDAMRVSKTNGGLGASRRVAYAWALSLGGVAGAKMLVEQDLIEPAINYAIDSGAYDHAFELARSACPDKMRDIHLKHALYLEDEEQYKEAEVEFLNANKPREAIEMYIHQQAWSEALSVATKHEPSATADVYLAQARSQADAGNHGHAEELFLLAGKPEYALAMYRSAGMWNEALSLAERHLPHQRADISVSCSRAGKTEKSIDSGSDFIAAGKRLEQQQQWGEAIAAYMQVQPDMVNELSEVVDLWNKTAGLAQRNLAPARAHCIIRDIIDRLRKIGRYESAAELHRDINDLDGGVECALAGQCWAKARELALGSAVLEARVSSAHEELLRTAADSRSLLQLGFNDAAIDVLVDSKDWLRVWQIADRDKLSSSERAKYAGLHAMSIVEDGGDILDAVETLARNGAPNFESHWRLYEKLVKTVLGRQRGDEHKDFDAYCTLVSRVKDILLCASGRIISNDRLSNLHQLQMANHYFHVYLTCTQEGLRDLAAKVSVTLLCYSGIIPVDKVFYIAGVSAREQGHNDLAFVLLNRYIDLSEAIDEGHASIADNGNFIEAAKIPCPFEMPTCHYVEDEHEREEMRDWVLSRCMDKSIDQRLPPKDAVSGTIYASLYPSSLPTCIITGFPVQPWESVRIGQLVANKVDWNRFVRKTRRCPFFNDDQVPICTS